MTDPITLQAENERLKQALLERDTGIAERDARLAEYERRDTERPTSRSGLLIEVMSELEENRRAVGNLCSTVETTGRMATEASRTISEDMPQLVEKAVSVAMANALIEVMTRLQQAEAKIEILEDWRRSRERACAGCDRLAAGQ